MQTYTEAEAYAERVRLTTWHDTANLSRVVCGRHRHLAEADRLTPYDGLLGNDPSWRCYYQGETPCGPNDTRPELTLANLRNSTGYAANSDWLGPTLHNLADAIRDIRETCEDETIPASMRFARIAAICCLEPEGVDEETLDAAERDNHDQHHDSGDSCYPADCRYCAASLTQAPA